MIDWREHLVRNPEICSGELCAAGARVPVTVILDSLAEGAGRDGILRDYPTQRSVHVDAALVYAAELVHASTGGLEASIVGTGFGAEAALAPCPPFANFPDFVQYGHRDSHEYE